MLYEAMANFLSWLTTLYGVFTLWHVLFTYDRNLSWGIVGAVLGVVVFLIIYIIIEPRCTSAVLTRKSKSRVVWGTALALAALLLILTSDPSKAPRPHSPGSPVPPGQIRM